MPSLAELTDYTDPNVDPVPADRPRVYIDNRTGSDDATTAPSVIQTVTNKLLGLNGEERYQLWPEKVVREGLSAAGDVISGQTPQWAVDPNTGDVHTSPQMIEKAQAMSAVAGTGGLAGTTDATLGATPFLRPALKYGDRLYKGKDGMAHADVIPDALYPEFQKAALAGDDISKFNFGFHNDKGQFLDREKALEYGINTGLIDPSAGKFGALTSTLLADSSKPGAAIEATAKAEAPYKNVPDTLMGFKKNGQNKSFDDSNFKHEQTVKITLPNGETFIDAIKGLNKDHALERANRNWEGSIVEPLNYKFTPVDYIPDFK